ncbi:uncharacterized protein LOC118264506 isoform X2 [Spodoptera frugiperda]|uniref:Uncharacterized protein LOC118264506 isoform X2 n=1 Tax=Spodoptera frugiperda TaxID=7108 RepID=A0A9R0CXS6_SPOFR|nr:uncharacterized protein LOC118264506 isoform X2 [Spodoptera frugiperda]
MAKRHTFPAYSIRRSKPSIRAVSQPLISMASVASSTSKTPSRMHCNDWEKFMKKASNYVCTMSALNGNYVAVIAIIVVVILSLLLPDITQKFHATHELKNMKKVLAKMSNEVRRAEVACLTVADEICCLHCNMHDDTTGTSTEKLQNLSICANYCMRTTQSEPITIEKKIGFLRRFFFPNPNTSHKEIAIMSYVYTDSFDAKQQDEEEEVM